MPMGHRTYGKGIYRVFPDIKTQRPKSKSSLKEGRRKMKQKAGWGLAISCIVTAKFWPRVCCLLGIVLRAVYTHEPHPFIKHLEGASHEPRAADTVVN